MHDRLLHLTDFHFWEVVRNPLRMMNKRFVGNLNVLIKRRRQFPMGLADAYADFAGSLGIRTALLTGDFASTSTAAEFEMARRFVARLESLGMTPIVMAGNHDVYTFESVRKRSFERSLGQWMTPGPLPCVITLPGGTPVVQIPTVRPNAVSSRGFIGTATIERIRGMLAEINGPAIVAAHYPILHDIGGYSAPRGRRLLNAGLLRDALGGLDHAVVYMAGHNHRFNLVRDPRYRNLIHLTTGSFFWHNAALGTKGEFSEVTIDGSEVHVVRHVFRSKWVTEAQAPMRF